MQDLHSPYTAGAILIHGNLKVSRKNKMMKTLHCLVLSVFLITPPAVYAVSDAEMLGIICNGCHGPKGVSVGLSIPSIAGLDRRYFTKTLLNYKKGERASSIMGRIARGYKYSDLRKISSYFSALDWTNTIARLDEEKILRGKKIHDELCEECHSENGRHQDHEIPRISGQVVNYLLLEMQSYQTDHRAMPQPGKMRERIKTLEVEELIALSHFYASGS